MHSRSVAVQLVSVCHEMMPLILPEEIRRISPKLFPGTLIAEVRRCHCLVRAIQGINCASDFTDPRFNPEHVRAACHYLIHSHPLVPLTSSPANSYTR